MTAECVHIVDDDAAVRDSLRWLLTSAGLEAKCYESAEAFLESGGESAVGVLVLDVRMEGMSGLELFGKLEAAGGPLPVIFLTGHGDVPLAVDAIKSVHLIFLRSRLMISNCQDRRTALVAGRKWRVTAEQSGDDHQETAIAFGA